MVDGGWLAGLDGGMGYRDQHAYTEQPFHFVLLPLNVRRDSVEILERTEPWLTLKYKVIKYPQNNTGQNGF